MNHILFPITYDCNLSCRFCFEKNRKEKVDIGACIRALIANRGAARWVYISGGEPFLVKSLPEICIVLRRYFKIGVTTNGTIQRPEIAELVDRIGISLDGDRDYHDAYRGPGVFDAAIAFFHTIKGKCETVIMSTDFKENKTALRRLEAIVLKLNPNYWQIQKAIGIA